jgi:hypothetical protein
MSGNDKNQYLDALPKGSQLSFNISLRWSGWEVEIQKNNPKEHFEPMSLVERSTSLVHETQHIRINMKVLLAGKLSMSGVKQHKIMKATDGKYYQERIRHSMQFYSKFLKHEGGNHEKAKELIKFRANSFDN